MCDNVGTATQPLTLLTLNVAPLIIASSPGPSQLSSCVLAFETAQQ